VVASSPLPEIACLLVRFDHVARVIENSNHRIMRPAVEFGVADCICDCIRLTVPQATEWKRIGD
jgi:hypothetical protein